MSKQVYTGGPRGKDNRNGEVPDAIVRRHPKDKVFKHAGHDWVWDDRGLHMVFSEAARAPRRLRAGPETGVVKVYDQVLAAIGNRASEIRGQVVTHWPHVGSDYRGLVILGQALNGWDDRFPVAQFRTPKGRSDALRVTRARNADLEDPIEWIATLAVRSSPFWSAARMVVDYTA